MAMKLNGCNISISKFSEETVEGEVIIFVEEHRRIVVLNTTATIIWRYILECYKSDIDIEYKDITDILIKTFGGSAPSTEELLIDIDDTVNQLCQSAIITK